MDLRKVTSEQIQNMTDEERRNYANAFVKMVKANPNIVANFYDPVKKQTITLSEVIKKLGEEKAADFLYQSLTTMKTRNATLTAAEYENLRKKASQGTLSEQEQQMLKMAETAFEKSSNLQYQRNGMGLLIGLADFAQNSMKYSPTIADVISISNLISLSAVSITNTKGTDNWRIHLNELKEEGDKIGEDMLHAWKVLQSEDVSTDKIIAGLCQALIKTAREANLELPPADVLFDYLDIDKNAYRMNNRN